MRLERLSYQPVEGKTYSLFGKSDSTCEYYSTIKSLADNILGEREINEVLKAIYQYSPRKRYLKRIISNGKKRSIISYCLERINGPPKKYTVNTENHLKNLPLAKFWDRRLATTEEQYHLYMLEIEMTNRLNRISFLQADRKISLQPYCLQDFSANCKAEDTGFDYQCKHCSKICFQNLASVILKRNNIEPYIWMGAKISKAAKMAAQNQQTFGILGIACIPELVFGMRKCRKYNIPVMGLPLNANRCKRWFGEFHKNSIDINALEKLISIT